MTGSEDPPLLRVVHGGEPTPEELAALTVAVSRLRAARNNAAEKPTSVWTDRSSALRRPLRAGPGAWVASGRP